MRFRELGAFIKHNLQLRELTVGATNLRVVIYYTALLGFLGHLCFIPLFLWLGVGEMAAINVLSCSAFVGCFWINRAGRPHAALLLGVAEVVGHAVLSVIYIGWNSGFHYYILGLVPLIFYSQQWRSATKLGLTAVLGAIYIALYFYTLNNPPWHVLTAVQLDVTGVLNIVTLFLVFAALAYYYRLAAALAEQALQNVNKQLEYLAHTDPLTHLANRRNMQERLQLAMKAYWGFGIHFSVILGDVDNFKQCNDQYGHDTGDAVLVMIADILRKSLREQDQVARWGGEEFLILVPGGDEQEASYVAERLRAAVASSPMNLGAVCLSITITLGVAEYRGEANTRTCVNRADNAMYQGKRQGRNRVMLSSAEEPVGSPPAE